MSYVTFPLITLSILSILLHVFGVLINTRILLLKILRPDYEEEGDSYYVSYSIFGYELKVETNVYALNSPFIWFASGYYFFYHLFNTVISFIIFLEAIRQEALAMILLKLIFANDVWWFVLSFNLYQAPKS